MKALPLLMLLPALAATQAVNAPTPLPLDTVLARHAAAVGPVENFQTRTASMLVVGMAPFEIPVISESMRPDLLLKRVTIQGAVQITGYDGRDAWRIDPFASSSGKAADVPAAELEDVIEEADFDGPLLSPGAGEVSLSYAGARVVEVAGKRTPVHAVGINWPNGRKAVAHLDAASFLEVLRTQRRPVMGNDMGMTITSSDYRTVNGIAVPFLIEILPEGMPAPIRLTMDKVEFGVALDRAAFRRP